MLTKENNFTEAAKRFQAAAEYEDEEDQDYEDNIMKHWYNAATAYVQVFIKP